MKADRSAASARQQAARGIAVLAATLWVGSLWSIGFLAVPVLFQTLPDKMLAGLLAGKMFTLVAWAGMGAAGYLLAYLAVESGKRAFREPLFWIASIMLLLTLAGEFGVQPEMAGLKVQALPADVMHSAFASRFQALHHFATGIYVVQCVLGLVLALRLKRC